MKELARQDRNGTRTSEELRRRYKLNEIDLTKNEVEYLKTLIVVDDSLSTTSTNAVQNKVITQALNNKVNKETGKGLSTNDFTDEFKEQLDTLPTEISELSNSIETYATLMQKKVPTGGTTGQVLAKKSNSDNDTQWVDKNEIIAITSKDLNTQIGKLIIGYGNETTNRPTGSQNGYLINLPHTGSPTTYNKQFWFNRMNNCVWSRSMENGVWTEWKAIDEDMNKTYNLASYKASGLTILRSSCIEKDKRVVINFTGTISMAANTTTTLFTLPEAIRPTEIKDFVAFGQTSNNDGYIGYGQISTEGSLQVRFNTAISSYIRFSVVYDLD